MSSNYAINAITSDECEVKLKVLKNSTSNCATWTESKSFRSCRYWSIDGSFCYMNSKIDFPTTFRGKRNVYMIGNSVTRHYSFQLFNKIDAVGYKEYMGNLSGRVHERDLCANRLLGSSSCDHYSKNNDTLIRYKWFPLLSATEQLSSYFINPKSDDILIIGSLLEGNKTAIGCMISNTCKSDWQDEFYSSFYGAKIDDYKNILLPHILSAFPGLIIWHSYSYLHTQLNEPAKPFRLSIINCRDLITYRIKCLIKEFNHPRLRFLDVSRYLEIHPEGYQDIVHHHGKLSDDVLKIMFRMIADIPLL